MDARLVLGAATAVLVTGTMLGHVPAAHAGDNDRRDWDDRRVVQTPGSADGAVHVLGNRGTMTTVVRELGAGTDQWRIRENRDGGLTFHPPISPPRTVQRFRYDESQLHDSIYAVYEHDGRLQAAEASPERSNGLTETGREGAGSDLGPAGTEAPKVVAGESSANIALITQDGTWYQHRGPVGGDPEGQPQGAPQGPAWSSYPDPNLDGVPGNAGESYAFAGDGALLVFWNAPSGDLMVARRAGSIDSAFSEPQTIATGGETMVDFVQTAEGNRLVTQATDGTISVWGYTAGVFFHPDERVQLPGTADVTQEPQVLASTQGAVTVAWREPIDGGGLMLWQEDRPGSTFLKRPTLVPGTRNGDARVVASPRGNLTVAVRRDSEEDIVRVKHLPAGKKKWTGSVRLISPKPSRTSVEWTIGSPQRNGDMRVAVNDRVGVYGFRFDAPRPVTKAFKPVRRVQRDRSYRIGWNTTWAFANDWQLRARFDKGRRYGKWRAVAVNFGDRSKVVTRPRGEKRCYSARGETIDGGFTRWSSQRCVTVRR
jgi:hypothetical protein